MIDYLKELFTFYGFSDELSTYSSNAIAIIMIAALCVVTMVITKKILLKMLKIYISKSKNKWDDVFLKNRVFERIASILPAIIIHESAVLFPAAEVWIKRIAFSYIVFVVLMALYR